MKRLGRWSRSRRGTAQRSPELSRSILSPGMARETTRAAELSSPQCEGGVQKDGSWCVVHTRQVTGGCAAHRYRLELSLCPRVDLRGRVGAGIELAAPSTELS